MKVLALDLGTVTGYCHGPNPNQGGVIVLPKPKQIGYRYRAFRTHLRFLLDENLVEAVYYEKVVRTHVSTNAAHLYGALEAMTQEEAALRNIPCVGVNVSTIKKHATQNGRASKEEMVAHAQVYLGKWITDHNEADARWLWDYAQANPEPPLPKKRRKSCRPKLLKQP